MHVVLDARYIAWRQSGVGAYAQRLITGLATIDRSNRYTCLVAADGPGLPVQQLNVAAAPTRVSFEDHLRGDLWLLGYLPFRLRALRADVYHGPAVFLPHIKLGYRTVVTIHDLVSFRFPETVPWRYSVYMRLMTRLAARSADRIIAVSHATKTDLVETLGVAPGKVVVIHEAVGAEFTRPLSPATIDAAVRRYGLRHPYCLFVGNLEPRKNLPALIEAFAEVRRRFKMDGRSMQLALVGTRAWLHAGIFRAVERHGLGDDVAFTGYVPIGDLPALYGGAACFVFPSLYEGFGLPVLEAMAAGAPVIAARTGSIPEVAGDAALLVDARVPGELAAAIEAVLSEAALRERLIARGRARAATFEWDAVARQTLAVYEAVYHRRACPGCQG
jgi:glycosyltransferase involved in cell wall biosynthesis